MSLGYGVGQEEAEESNCTQRVAMAGKYSTKARGPVLGEGPGLVAVGGFRAALGNGTSAPCLCRQLLSYITKDKQTESLVGKLCQRFRTARTERQYRDLAYCVSQLPLTERGLRKMMDNFDCFGDKLSEESIFNAFSLVVGKLRRGAKPDSKAIIDEFEQKLRACHTRGLDAIEEIGQVGSQKTPSAKKQSTVSRHQHLSSATSDNDFVTPEPRRTAHRHPNTQQRATRKKPRIVFSSDESSEEELSAEWTEDETPKKTTPIRRASTRRHRS